MDSRGTSTLCIAVDVELFEMAMVLKHLYHARGNDGNDYEVHVYVEPASHENAHIERLAKVCLADGGELRVLSRRHYEIVATGIRLEAHDPEAI